MAKQIRFTKQPLAEGQAVADVAVFDAAGNPVDVATGSTTVTSASITDASATGRNVLTAKDAAAARTAIGAGTSSFTGSYNDLSNKPTIPAAYTLPAASATVLGGVKKAAAVANVGAADAKPATGDAPTKAEHDAVVTELNEVKAKLNALLANGRAAGFLA